MVPVRLFNIAGPSFCLYRFLEVREIEQGPYLPWNFFLFSWEGRIEGQVFWC